MTTEVRHTSCPLDCPDRCSLDVDIRDGRVVGIRGNRVHSLTADFICTKVSRFGRRLYGPDRVLYPQRRVGPKGSESFERISWQAAVEEITSRFRDISSRHGSEAILPYCYGGSNGLMTQGLVDAHYFARLGASRLARTLCAASTNAASDALYGKMPGTAFEDYEQAEFILIWGANPSRSNIHLVPFLKAARRRGARIAVVDPRRTMGDELVDRYLQIYPGTDLAVALAIIHHLDGKGCLDYEFLKQNSIGWERLLECAAEFPLERAASIARVPADEIAALAEDYSRAKPAVLRCGWGLERNRNGLAAVAAVLALPAVAGKFGEVGAGYTLSNGGAFKVDEAELSGATHPKTRLLNMNLLGRYLTEEADPPVKALFVYNCNPAVTVPDQNRVLRGLQREDLFTVVLDQVQTDTALYADIILPATTFLEHTELNKSYGGYALQLGEPVIEPVGEALPNLEVFQRLGRAMGWTDGLFAETPEELLARAVRSLRSFQSDALSVESLRASRVVQPDFPGPHPVQFRTVYPGTPGQKIRLYPEALGDEPYRYLEDSTTESFPLALISPSSSRTVSSTLGEFNLPRAELEMHPDDARERGLSAGMQVRLFNNLGEVHCTLRIDPRLRPGVVSLPKGLWRRASSNGQVGTALVPDTLTPVSGGACFNDARVEVQALTV